MGTSVCGEASHCLTLFVTSLCSDAELVRSVWDRYDAEDSGSKVFTSLITALKRLVTERPALLGVGQQMFGVGVSTHPSSSADGAYALDVGGMAGMVASAASATVSGVANMMTTEAGLSVQTSAMKLQWYVCRLLWLSASHKVFQHRPAG